MLTEHARGADYKSLTKLLEPSIATWMSRDRAGSGPVLLHARLREKQMKTSATSVMGESSVTQGVTALTQETPLTLGDASKRGQVVTLPPS